jgi:lipoprotein-anchoring transpeptidase ErfK/SrfK
VSESERKIIGSRRRGLIIAAVVALVALAPIIAGIIITSSPVRAHADSGLAFSQPPPSAPATPAKRTVPGGSGYLVALIKHATTMRVAPGGAKLAHLPTRTPFGSPQALWVRQQRGSWLGVVSPLAGNGRIGWIPRSATTLGRVDWELKVSLAARRLTVIDNGKPVQHYTVAIGRPTAPTPTGHFAVTDRLLTGDPTGPYGCCILALSAESPHAIQGWNGGNRIAIHSTPETSTIGEPVSHGCVRVTLADGRWLLAHIPLGTPTLIST